MIIFKSSSDLKQYLETKKSEGKSIGFVPTMGALHAGHISLVSNAKEINDITVASIFVNPTQFNNRTDFQKYPVTIEQDIDMLESSGCEILFHPAHAEVYPDNNLESYDLGYLETILEGKYRPGHFQGVCQVVRRLLDIVQPDDLYLGQKDYQQCLVIKKLSDLAGFHINIHIKTTVREPDGLAMSSRNMRLNVIERLQAVKIYEALIMIKQEMKGTDLAFVKNKAVQFLTQNEFKVDYIEIADARTLFLLDHWDGNIPAVILIAAYLHDIRLIDNLVIG